MTRAPRTINHAGLDVPEIEAFLEKCARLSGGVTRGSKTRIRDRNWREQFISDGVTTLELLEPLREGLLLGGSIVPGTKE